MERILVVVFDNEKKAYEGKSALRQLEVEGSTSTHAGVVVLKDVDGTVSVKQLDDDVPIGSFTLTAVGSLLGLLGGPAGLAVGALAGLTFGAFCDIDAARVGEDIVGDVSRSLAPNTAAVIAEIDEEWTTPVDTLMEALGGVVFRHDLWNGEDIGAMKADLAHLKRETSKTHSAAAGRPLKELANTRV